MTGIEWYFPALTSSAGALIGAALAVVINRFPLRLQICIALGLVALAVAICEYSESTYFSDDSHYIVADEALTFPVATLGLPVRSHPWLLGGVFVLSRVLDGLKPPPAKAAEDLHGGLGIVFDDVVGNCWTLLISLMGWKLLSRPRT
jgi:phosphatidylglycerophosphatase A